MSRRVTIQTPLGEALQFRQLVGREALSQLYTFDIELLGSSNAIDPKALLGKASTVVVETESGVKAAAPELARALKALDAAAAGKKR